MNKKNSKKKGISKKTILAIMITISILLIISFFYLLIEGGIIKNNPSIKEKNFTIEDKCSIIVGKIIHPIDREDECINKCVAQCETYKLNYEKAEFELRQNACNSCNCYCK